MLLLERTLELLPKKTGDTSQYTSKTYKSSTFHELSKPRRAKQVGGVARVGDGSELFMAQGSWPWSAWSTRGAHKEIQEIVAKSLKNNVFFLFF